MAQIRRIGYDHQAPFVLGFLLLLLFLYQVAKTNYHTANLPQPQFFFYRFWTPYKMHSRGLIRSAQTLLTPLTPLPPPIGEAK